MNERVIVLAVAVASLLMAGCGFQLVGSSLAEDFDGYQVNAPSSSKVGMRLERQLEDSGMRAGGEKQIGFQIVREAFTAGRSLASKAATTAEIQLNLSVVALITPPGEEPFKVEYKLHDFYPINFTDPHANRALRRSLEDNLAGEVANLMIESVANPTPH